MINTEQLAIQNVLESGFVSGLVRIDDETWAIYGSIPVDGQVIVAEFDSRAGAESVLEGIVAADRRASFAGQWK